MKTVIVTGAAGNLGQAIVRKFLAETYNVIGTINPGNDFLPNTSNEKLEKVTVDVMNEKATEEFVATVINKYGAIDAAILTVGGFALGSIAETSGIDLQQQYKLNFETAYHVARPVFKQMLTQQQGRIFIIGSKPGLSSKNSKGMVAYSLSKSLLFRLAELMNDEAKGTNVVTSVIVPSTIDTPQNRKAMPESDPSKWVRPEEIAEIIYFYCSSAANTIREPVIKIYNNA